MHNDHSWFPLNKFCNFLILIVFCVIYRNIFFRWILLHKVISLVYHKNNWFFFIYVFSTFINSFMGKVENDVTTKFVWKKMKLKSFMLYCIRETFALLLVQRQSLFSVVFLNFVCIYKFQMRLYYFTSDSLSGGM